MRYRLRTLLIVLALGPVLLAFGYGVVQVVAMLVARAATAGAEGF